MCTLGMDVATVISALVPRQGAFFFFQAEDGIRDLIVTGVQTCALPISSHDQISYAVFCLRSEEHTSELQSRSDLVCRLLLEKKKNKSQSATTIIMIAVVVCSNMLRRT